MSIIALVPLRAGSKGIKNKNIVDLCGKPLFYWCVKSLVESKFVDKVFVATDSDLIAESVKCEFLNSDKVFIYRRLPENAQDNSLTIDLVLEFIEHSEYLDDSDYLCLVQATSPLLTNNDVDKLLENFNNSSADSSLSCVETRKYHWTLDGDEVGHVFSQRTPRQHRKNPLLVENGAVYLNKITNIVREKCLLTGCVLPYIMDYDSVWEIDTIEDLEFVERLMKRKRDLV